MLMALRLARAQVSERFPAAVRQLVTDGFDSDGAVMAERPRKWSKRVSSTSLGRKWSRARAPSNNGPSAPWRYARCLWCRRRRPAKVSAGE